MNRKQRRITESQNKNNPVISIRGQLFTPEQANAWAMKELQQRNLRGAADIFALIRDKFPDVVEVHINLGNIYFEMGRYDEALTSYVKALALKPDHAPTYYNKAFILRNLGRYEEALHHFDKAIALKPDYTEAYNNRGLVLQALHKFDDALASYDKALSLHPDSSDAAYNKALLQLLLGEFDEGWKLYETRWKSVKRNEYKIFKQPLWLGKESLAGKTILLRAEQGLGDTIQLCRYAPLIEAMGAKVILSVPTSLKALLSSLKGSFQLIAQNEPLPDYDFHCPLFSLPLALHTRLDTIPANVPYLFADPNKQKNWQNKLGEKKRARIGLVWSGAAKHHNDHNRSIPLKLLAPLLANNIEFHSLQLEIKPEDAQFFANSAIISHKDEIKDLADTAALITEMDIVVTVDTSVAHLAGALGKPVWILLPFTPDFRWMLERQDSPWYPTARLFRQSRRGDWNHVIADIQTEIKSLRS